MSHLLRWYLEDSISDLNLHCLLNIRHNSSQKEKELSLALLQEKIFWQIHMVGYLSHSMEGFLCQGVELNSNTQYHT